MESTPTLKSTLSNLHIWVRRSSSFHHSSGRHHHHHHTPPSVVGVCVCVCLQGLGHGFEGLQYEVGLVDEPVCADEDVYCPGNREQAEFEFKQPGVLP